jgi:hypothetical protein
VIASRGRSVVFAPPRCTSVPANSTTDPAGISTGRRSGWSAVAVGSLQRWLPGMISVAPLSAVNSSIAQIALTPIIGRGHGNR